MSTKHHTMTRRLFAAAAAAAVAVVAIVTSFHASGSHREAFGGSAMRHAPDHVTVASDATSKRSSSTGLGAPPASEKAKRRSDGGGDPTVR